jgi:23S rRNA pseudouridine955/2504/2580 synthase
MAAKPLKNREDSSRVRHREIGDAEAGQRLDNFLLRIMKGVPKSRIYRAIRRGEVRVDGSRAAASRKLRAGESVRLPPLRQAENETVRPSGTARAAILHRIIYEDERLLAINKPSGLASHGGSGLSFGAIELLRASRPDLAYLELVHRLDRATSGCLLFAKRRSALRAMHEKLRGNAVDKRYLALLAGRLAGGNRRVDAPLATHMRRGGERVVMVEEETGKNACSIFEPVQIYHGATLAAIRIETGRTHQIRVHAASIGHPVIGDDKYGDREVNRRFRALGLKRMFLHAQALTFERPGSGESLCISAPMEPELQRVLEQLKPLGETTSGSSG